MMPAKTARQTGRTIPYEKRREEERQDARALQDMVKQTVEDVYIGLCQLRAVLEPQHDEAALLPFLVCFNPPTPFYVVPLRVWLNRHAGK